MNNHEKLKKVLKEIFNEEYTKIKPGSDFKELSSWDSLKYVTLVVAIQSEFEVELSMEQIQLLSTLDGLVKGLIEHGKLEPEYCYE